MLGRLFSGLLHPLIHVGYGLEFGLKGMLVEGTWRGITHGDECSKSWSQGLALTAVHALRIRGSLPPSLFDPGFTNDVGSIVDRLSSLSLDTPVVASTPVSKTGGVHAFDIVASIIKDERLKRRALGDVVNHFSDVLAEYAPVVQEHVAKWTVDLNQPDEIDRKLEEVIWVSSLIYGVGGFKPNGFKANFFLCVSFLCTMVNGVV